MWQEPPSEPKLTIGDTERSFDFWMNRPFIPTSLRAGLSNANVLFVPMDRWNDADGPLFPEGTESLLDYLRDNSPDGVSVDICITDDKYKELALHDATVVIAMLVVSNIVCPLVVNQIQRYLDTIRSSKRHPVKIQIVIDENGKAREIVYEGPVEQFASTVGSALGSGSPDAAASSPRGALEPGSVSHDAVKRD